MRWLRPRGVRPSGDRGTNLACHLTVDGAVRMHERRDIPAVLSDLIAAGTVRYEPGARLGRTKHSMSGARAGGVPPVGAPANAPAPPVMGGDEVRTPASSASIPPRPCFRFAELFAGIGGFRVGLEAVGGECVFASEMDPHAAATYSLNFGAAPCAGDITEIEAAVVPEHDVLVGGFPCQTFSSAGEQAAFADARGQLYLEVCRVLCARRPRAFLLENVACLYTVGGGVPWNGRYCHDKHAEWEPGPVYTTIVAALRACGYVVQTRVLGADAFGLPQFRDRLYFVGFADGADADRFTWPNGAARGGDGAEPVGATVGSILEPATSTAVAQAELTPAQWSKIQPILGASAQRRVADLNDKARTLVSSYRSGWHRHSELVPPSDCDAELIPHASDDGPTGGALAVDVGRRPRFFTARECARLMGFPESFVVPGHPTREKGAAAFEAYSRFYHQIGNAVCPPVVQALADAMREAMQIRRATV